MGRRLLEGIRSYYEDANASVRLNRELCESFGAGVGVKRMRDVTLAVQYLYGWRYKSNESQSRGFRC